MDVRDGDSRIDECPRAEDGGEIRGRVVAVVAAGAGGLGDGARLVQVADRAHGAAGGRGDLRNLHSASVHYDAA